MHPEVERLILLQDLDLMIQEFSDAKKANAEKKLGFDLGDLSTLQSARDDLVKRVDPSLLKRYERLRDRYPRPIVPIKDGVCFGCFVRRPEKQSVAEAVQDDIEFCERCARILFRYQVP